VGLLSFFDPVCTPGCPPIGQELRQAARLLRGSARQLELVGIVLSPARRSVAALRAFDRQAGLSRLPDWLFLTGTPARLQQVRQDYGITSPAAAGGTSPDRDAVEAGAAGLGAANLVRPAGWDRAGTARPSMQVSRRNGWCRLAQLFGNIEFIIDLIAMS
jgi:hypothetical protein